MALIQYKDNQIFNIFAAMDNFLENDKGGIHNQKSTPTLERQEYQSRIGRIHRYVQRIFPNVQRWIKKNLHRSPPVR